MTLGLKYAPGPGLPFSSSSEDETDSLYMEVVAPSSFTCLLPSNIEF